MTSLLNSKYGMPGEYESSFMLEILSEHFTNNKYKCRVAAKHDIQSPYLAGMSNVTDNCTPYTKHEDMFIYVTATPHLPSYHGARKTRIDFVVGSAGIINDGLSRKETAHCELPEPV